jgi:hypothetical protein
MMMSEDATLHAALEASVRSANAVSGPLALPFAGANAANAAASRRGARAAPLQHHFGARAGCARDGEVRSLPGLNQFHDAFRPLIARHGTAGSICGYTTCAIAKILVERVCQLRAAGMAAIGPELLREAVVGDMPRFLQEVEAAMALVRHSRETWISLHPELFPTERSRTNHLQGWVANYELSDLISTLVAPGLDGAHAPPVDFVRFNQWHEVSGATPDERARIEQEERKFGGRADPSRPGQATFKEGESVFIVERFEKGGRRCLQTPEEWWKAERATQTAEPRRYEQQNGLRIFCVDLHGHFSAGWSIEPGRMFFINTTQSAYADNAIVDWYYDLRFPPFQDAAGRDASSCQVGAQQGSGGSAATMISGGQKV